MLAASGDYSPLVSPVLRCNGKGIPRELRSRTAGHYVEEDEATTLTPQEETGLVEALQAIDRGDGESAQKVRRAIAGALRR